MTGILIRFFAKGSDARWHSSAVFGRIGIPHVLVGGEEVSNRDCAIFHIFKCRLFVYISAVSSSVCFVFFLCCLDGPFGAKTLPTATGTFCEKSCIVALWNVKLLWLAELVGRIP